MTKEERLQNEYQRLSSMYEEQHRITEGYSYVFGIDEAGRGPLCGPVSAACCLLEDDLILPCLNDSKKLSEKKREELYDEILSNCLSYGIGLVGPERIDEINILNATYEAMNDAFEDCLARLEEKGIDRSLLRNSSVVLVDGNRRVPQLRASQITLIGGDAKCPSISAASILAKVTRDRLLVEYDRLYPEYGFAKHKGYGTAAHIEALGKYGPTPIHRMSFIQKFIHG